jgi:hypothetical protein
MKHIILLPLLAVAANVKAASNFAGGATLLRGTSSEISGVEELLADMKIKVHKEEVEEPMASLEQREKKVKTDGKAKDDMKVKAVNEKSSKAAKDRSSEATVTVKEQETSENFLKGKTGKDLAKDQDEETEAQEVNEPVDAVVVTPQKSSKAEKDLGTEQNDAADEQEANEAVDATAVNPKKSGKAEKDVATEAAEEQEANEAVDGDKGSKAPKDPLKKTVDADDAKDTDLTASNEAPSSATNDQASKISADNMETSDAAPASRNSGKSAKKKKKKGKAEQMPTPEPTYYLTDM